MYSQLQDRHFRPTDQSCVYEILFFHCWGFAKLRSMQRSHSRTFIAHISRS